MRTTLSLLVILGAISGCTGDSGSKIPLGNTTPIFEPPASGDSTTPTSPITPEVPSSPGAVEPVVTSPKTVEEKIETIQKQMIEDTQYSFVDEDIALLESEGLLENKEEMKGWVK